MNIAVICDKIKSCIANLGFDGMSEKLFEVYSKCSTVSTRGPITNYQTVSNVAECFNKQYPSLSKFAASECIPKELKKSFLDCMNFEREGFLSYVYTTYKKATLWFNGNTLGNGFQSKLEFCSVKSCADEITSEKFQKILEKFEDIAVHAFRSKLKLSSEKLSEISKTTKPVIELDNSTFLYIATALGVIAITTYILWKISHRNREQH